MGDEAVVPITAGRRRTGREDAADVVWALIAAGFVTDLEETVPYAGRQVIKIRAVLELTGITDEDLRLARWRADRRRPAPVSPPAPVARPRAPLPPAVYDRQPIPAPGDLRPPTPLTGAGRRAAAEAIFASWKAQGNLNCTRCGKPMCSGETVEIEAAHHLGRCP